MIDTPTTSNFKRANSRAYIMALEKSEEANGNRFFFLFRGALIGLIFSMLGTWANQVGGLILSGAYKFGVTDIAWVIIGVAVAAIYVWFFFAFFVGLFRRVRTRSYWIGLGMISAILLFNVALMYAEAGA